jgi:YVTN family beta-propeller protein
VAVEDRIEVGHEVAGYRLDELAGRGGMGEVYRAYDTRLDRNVALKLLAPRYADDESFRDRLLRESRLAASLDHPNVVPVYDAGDAEGRFYIAMRYVEGTDLRALLRGDGPLEPARAVEIAAQVAGALDAAHERGLVHRDVKPSNVLVDGRGHCYLADFGLTQSISDRGVATDGHLLGTLDYVAPEQVRGEEVDGRADVYALGCLLFECLTGDVPFRRQSDVATIYAHLEDEPPRATDRRPELPAAVDTVLARAMAKDRADRPATCGDVVVELREALGLEAHRPPRRRAVVAIGAVVLALVAAAAVGLVVLLTGSEAPPAGPSGSIVRVDASTGAAAEPIRVGPYPASLAASQGIVWVGSIRESSLWKVSGATGTVERVPASGSPRDIAIWGGTAYVASDGATLFTGTVSQYDFRTGFRRGSVDVLACSLTAGAVGVWAAGCPNVVQLESTTDRLRVARTVPIPFRDRAVASTYRVCLCGMTTGYGSVWAIGDWSDSRLWRIDPVKGRIARTYELPFRPRSFAVGAGGVWVVDPVDDRVARLDPTTGAVTAMVDVGRGASGVAVGAGSVWVTNQLEGTLSRIDPDRAAVAATIDVGPHPVEVTVDGSDVWVVLEGA